MQSILDRVNQLITDRFGEKHGRYKKFAELTGLPQETISKWFNRGVESLNSDTIYKICETTGVSPSWLLFGTEPEYEIDHSRMIPVIDWRTVGNYSDGETEMVLERIDAGHAGPRAYALKMDGYGAMKPTIQDNTVVVIDPAVEWDDGDIVLTTGANRQIWLGRIKKMGRGYVILFDNRDFPPLEIERNQVLGRAVEMRTRL